MHDGEGELIVGRGKITSLGVTLFHVVDNRDERPDCHILLMWCEMLVHLSWPAGYDVIEVHLQYRDNRTRVHRVIVGHY